MAKHQTYQKFIYKVHSSDIIKQKMNFNRTLSEMHRKGEIVSLADSEVLRFIDEINEFDVESADKSIAEIKRNIKIKQKSVKNVSPAQLRKVKNEIKTLYDSLDKIQLKADYAVIIMDRKSHIDDLEQGFKLNGREYKRLLGTPNGVKKSSVVYVTVTAENGKPMYAELQRRLDNGRDLSKQFVPAKFEAYKALACSSSTPVTKPKGILVVDDLIVHFTTDVIMFDDKDANEVQHIEPTCTHGNMEVELDENDGYGLITPQLAEQWSQDLKLDYTLGGCCIRNAFCKGMMYPFDFQEFAKRYAKDDTVTDVWGRTFNIQDIEMVLPTSMLKLWDSYSSLDDYLQNCESNHYHFAVTKVCPKTLDEERTLNYQFIQSYQLSDEQITELVQPSIDEYKDILGGDVNKSLLFMGGMGMTADNVEYIDDDCIKALMVEPELIKDPYIISRINSMLQKRITDLKIGVAKVKGNFSLISGDPYALCQHIFKTNVDSEGSDKVEELGLLRAHEIYSKFWVDKGVNEVVCFRAPMSCHNNVVKVSVVHSEEADYWYQYMNTVTLVNCHDAMAHSMNGFDKDGDIIFTTNNKVLLDNWRYTPSIICNQRSAPKCVVTDELLRQSNKAGFGDEIGSTTNKITAMYDVISDFAEDSEEYKALAYRIQCGQLYQQNCIDCP